MLRFPPGGPDHVKKIRDEAKWTNRRCGPEKGQPWYRLSTWGDVPRNGETLAQLMQRLVHAAGMNNVKIDEDRNSVFWWSTAGELYDRGFTLKKDNDPDEAEEHFSVDLGGDVPSRERVEQFVQAFRGPVPTQGAGQP